MQLFVEKNYEAMSLRTAAGIVSVIRAKPDALLCLAAGDTPKLAYAMVPGMAAKEKLDITRCRFVSLDEWVGIPPSNEGSCQFFLRNTIFHPLNIADQNIHLFNALSPDLENECRMMDDFISSHGGIDLMVVGVGRNGHIGFNEPGVPFNKYSHVVPLDETTQSVGQKYFKQSTALTSGITLGLQHLLESRKVIMIANGEKKAAVMRLAMESPVDPSVPAGIVRQHPDADVILDEEAAALLKQR